MHDFQTTHSNDAAPASGHEAGPSKVFVTRRDAGIDAFRFLMAMLVIVLHLLPTEPTLPLGMKVWALIIDTVCRCAVPFFLITAGYYFRETRNAVINIKNVILQIAPIYVFWWAAYLGASFFLPGRWPTTWKTMQLIDGGVGYHLWFLPAFVFGVIVLSISHRFGGWRLALGVSVVFALIGPLLANYHVAFGMENYPRHLMDFGRQMAAPAFVFIGFVLRRAPQISSRISSLLCLFSIIGMVAERYILVFCLHNHSVGVDGFVSIYVYGASVFLLARSLNGYDWTIRLASLGSLSLGIYVCHLFYVFVAKLVTPTMPARTLVMFCGVAVAATITAAILGGIPGVRNLVLPSSARRTRTPPASL